jgi:hypothetical protein
MVPAAMAEMELMNEPTTAPISLSFEIKNDTVFQIARIA